MTVLSVRPGVNRPGLAVRRARVAVDLDAREAPRRVARAAEPGEATLEQRRRAPAAPAEVALARGRDHPEPPARDARLAQARELARERGGRVGAPARLAP